MKLVISLSLILLAALVAILPLAAAAQTDAPGATFTVNSTNDVNDGTCNAAHCSLREAIIAADALGADSIAFNIPGGGTKTISPQSVLPFVTGPVTIDGLTQPGASCAAWPPTLRIELDGSQAGGPLVTGLDISGGFSTVRGLVINSWSGFGILLDSLGNKAECNFLGANVAGTAAEPNFIGISVIAASSNNIGGNVAGTRNLISGNGSDGVWIDSNSSSTAVYGNYIGTDVTGMLDLGNGNNGISINDSDNNAVGLPNPASRNVISGNDNAGIVFDGGADSNSVVSNYIGINAAGTAALPNSQAGVFILQGDNNFIGHDTSVTRNIISGNGGIGVQIAGPSTGNFIQANYIGLNPAGTATIPNLDAGVRLYGGANQNTVGGPVDAARNMISGNAGDGVYLQEPGTDNNRVERNFIGVAADGVTAVGNAGVGIALADAASTTIVNNVIAGNEAGGVAISLSGANNNSLTGNKIGVAADGVTPLGNGGTALRGGGTPGVSIYQGNDNEIGGISGGDGNIIAYHSDIGVSVTEGTGNSIRGNSIHDNAELGIDLDHDGVTANDPLDPDIGGNLLQNFPTLTSASVAGGVSVGGTINTTPNTGITISVYGNSACDASGNGEGGTFIGEVNVTTAANGDGSFATTFPVTPGGFWLTATATDPAGNTSEFSPCRALSCYLDFNSNGQVDAQDIMQVAARWNNPAAYSATYDVAPPFSSPIDINDVIAVAEQWGATCP